MFLMNQPARAASTREREWAIISSAVGRDRISAYDEIDERSRSGGAAARSRFFPPAAKQFLSRSLSLSLFRFFTFPLLSRSRIFPTFPCRPPCTYTRSLVRSLSVGFIIVFLFAFPSGATRRAAAVAVPAILPTGHDNSFHSLSSAVNHTAQTRDTPVCYASAEGSTHLGIYVRSLWTFINYFARAPTFWSAWATRRTIM